jgi:chromosome segregation ATPase
MLKRMILSGAAVSALGMFFLGRDAMSYVGTSLGWIKDSVKNSVPIDFEIQRARRMIKDLVPDIRSNMQLIAKEEVEVEHLDQQIAGGTARLDRERGEIMRLKGDLASNRKQFEYAGRRYDANQVKTDLAHRFERYKTNDATLTSLQEMHRARERSLEAARQKLQNMLAVKRQLEVDVEHLEARLKMVETAQTTSNYNFDDSQLSRAKQLVSDLRTRLDVAERLVNSESEFQGKIPLEETTSENILDEVTDYFTPSGTKVAKADPVPSEE